MLIRHKDTVNTVDWGNGLSHRLLVESDGMGFAMAHTVVAAGTSSRLQYRQHLEACYCVSGKGEVHSADGSVRQIIEPGVLYALDQHDAHTLIAASGDDMHLISVFNPPIRGDERHRLDPDGYSQY
ncbi:ectoine synthase [Actinokineospora globicatena]|uniref:L-ectoine synthase n=1 Tax=Actinokineospora globicatena TaxID=103729 RepID=A0A9W6V9P9_9PSEU|nr:ectoine synthase [Actinokineospora globicatena]MCP2302898.1 L-ectoine synthase [Actinokineospora globicatena]GLW78718.1 L-ectoine synthase [Actinokineospora globicatena]GLW84614.1 L-ectoine synthase [Actinokineospora globicatena]GLW91188.1 L-ectoine synthase [Actinokineospora globicatena]